MISGAHVVVYKNAEADVPFSATSSGSNRWMRVIAG
jgi:hypothetical protein